MYGRLFALLLLCYASGAIALSFASRYALVVEETSGTVLLSKNADIEVSIADHALSKCRLTTNAGLKYTIGITKGRLRNFGARREWPLSKKRYVAFGHAPAYGERLLPGSGTPLTAYRR